MQAEKMPEGKSFIIVGGEETEADTEIFVEESDDDEETDEE
jgi:hypothetical protein